MNQDEKDRIQEKIVVHRGFLRNMYKISNSPFKLRKFLSGANLAQLKVLLAILRATSKGAIPIEKARYTEINRNHFFKRVIVKDFIDYREYINALNLGRAALVDFTSKLLSVWKHLLAALFVLPLRKNE
jgi:hypothetical protein